MGPHTGVFREPNTPLNGAPLDVPEDVDVLDAPEPALLELRLHAVMASTRPTTRPPSARLRARRPADLRRSAVGPGRRGLPSSESPWLPDVAVVVMVDLLLLGSL
jgi:hypothetical protein